MYICLECGQAFETPRVVREWHSELPGLNYETITECPACQSTNYEPADTCRKCGAYISKSQAGSGLCPDCEIDTETRFKEMLSTFTPEELAYLNRQYDGRWLGE